MTTELIGDRDVETSILAACLMSPSVTPRLLLDHHLNDEHFAEPVCQTTWQAIVAMHDRGDTIEPVGLTAELNGRIDHPRDWTLDLVALEPPVGALPGLLQRLKRYAERRKMQHAGWLYTEAAQRDDEQIATKAEALLAHSGTVDDETSPQDLGGQAVDYLTATHNDDLTTGFPVLDRYLGGGLKPGDCTALGAWTSMGKSVLVDQILAAAAANGANAHAYINEMSSRDRALRMIARHAGVDISALMRKQLTGDQHRKVLDAANRLPFGLTDCSQWTAAQVARHIRARRWDIAALDLLHNMPYREESELHQMVATLAAGARTAGCHLILVCQFNEARSIGERLPRPVIRDIRGSGMVKNLCANVLLLHREQHDEGGFITTQREGLLTLGKARHGQQGSGISLEFLPELMTFRETSGLRSVA
jgi:replicative DNA helicase